MPPNKTRKKTKHPLRKSRSNTPAKFKKVAEGLPRSRTKQDTMIGLLRQPRGVTISAMMKATGWQQHSVRGFLAGVVCKKLGLTLTSEKIEGERVYRIIAGKPSKAKSKDADLGLPSRGAAVD